ncbi:MAG: hypothetical protein KDC90_07940 [Ignavibacteriae bacterium]|nr:hypothetical protein [Ignavibacteriota bacterium]
MKSCFVFLLLLITQNEMNERYELFLGQKISDLEIKLGTSDYNKTDERYSYFFFDDQLPYYNNYANAMFVRVDDKERIKSIDIKLTKLINDVLYNELIKQYGNPNSILVVDEIISLGTSVNDTTGATMKKNFLKTKEGSFEEQPLHIIWNKDSFKIEVLMKYEQNLSEITFSVLREGDN